MNEIIVSLSNENADVPDITNSNRKFDVSLDGTPGGMRTTIAMHCGFKIFKMAAKVEKFRGLYALFFNRYNSFLRSFFSIS